MTVPGINEAKVGDWLARHIAGVAAPFEYELIAGGHSNLTFAVTDAAGRRLVLRRPPLGRVLATAHDVTREHRIISALGPTSVPVPPALGVCADQDVISVPFYVMDFVDGIVLDGPQKAVTMEPAARRQLGFDFIDVLADLHAVDIDAVGLGDLARREAYIERQLRRWSKQWEASKTRELPAMEEVLRLLESGIPPQRDATIVHGDFRLGNCIVDPSQGSVRSVLDWELCTLGDPLADVGYLRLRWAGPDGTPLRATDPTTVEAFLSYDELLERYAMTTGRDLSDISYYAAFQTWRLAAILEGVYARYIHGAMAEDGTDVAGLKDETDRLAELALESARGLEI